MTTHHHTPRPVEALHRGMPATDGAGVTMTRLIGTPDLPMLDHFHSDRPDDYLAGFPDHPHRGFETVTIMLAGRMRHHDNKGNSGLIGPGGVQWMTAGSGLIHSEMPEQEDGLMSGFQLWVNLPAAAKSAAPGYQDLRASAIPVETRPGGGTVRVIAGTTAQGTAGPARSAAATPLLLDVSLPAGETFIEPVPASHSTILALYAGSLGIGESTATSPSVAVLGHGDTVAPTGKTDARFLLIAAAPLDEPVARYGPFVMTTREELAEAFDDYQAGRF